MCFVCTIDSSCLSPSNLRKCVLIQFIFKFYHNIYTIRVCLCVLVYVVYEDTNWLQFINKVCLLQCNYTFKY